MRLALTYNPISIQSSPRFRSTAISGSQRYIRSVSAGIGGYVGCWHFGYCEDEITINFAVRTLKVILSVEHIFIAKKELFSDHFALRSIWGNTGMCDMCLDFAMEIHHIQIPLNILVPQQNPTRCNRNFVANFRNALCAIRSPMWNFTARWSYLIVSIHGADKSNIMQYA